MSREKQPMPHPWDFEDTMFPLRPLPAILPLVMEGLPPVYDTKIEPTIPRGAVHNGFVPPVQSRRTSPIIQPNPQSGNKIGRRQ